MTFDSFIFSVNFHMSLVLITLLQLLWTSGRDNV